MKVVYGYQYYNFEPDEINRDQGEIDLQKALLLWATFPWDEQIEGVSNCEIYNQSFTTPTIYFNKSVSNFISISAYSDKYFFIHIEVNNRACDFLMLNNVLGRPEEISVEKIISDFFNGDITEKFELQEIEFQPSEVIEFIPIISRFKIFRPLLYALSPVLLILYDYEVEILFAMMIAMSILILIVMMPRLFLNFTFWRNDKDQMLSYNPKKRELTIIQKKLKFTLNKSDIIRADIINPYKNQKPFSEFSYVRLITVNETFIITYLTVDPFYFLNRIKLNYNNIEYFFPRLIRTEITERDLRKKASKYKRKRDELLITYSDWETEKLEKVVAKTTEYEDYARSAAKRILKERKNN